jgi:putative ABC transport system permease protein
VAPPDFQFPNEGVWRAWFPARIDIYTPLALTPEQMSSRRRPSLAVVAAARSQVYAIDQNQSLTNIQTMEELLAGSISQRRFNLLLLGVFAGLALLLAGVGIYGVMSYMVAQRRHEIGVRMALGARAFDVLKLVIRQGMTLTLTGVVIGLITALGLTRLIKNLLFDVSTTDPLTFSMIAVLLVGVALLACYLPARRAARLDPMIALRAE